jgi:hypothetical protein
MNIHPAHVALVAMASVLALAVVSVPASAEIGVGTSATNGETFCTNAGLGEEVAGSEIAASRSAGTWMSGATEEVAGPGGKTLWRVWSSDGSSQMRGSFLTEVQPASSAQARATLALPPGNTADMVTEVQLAPGTRYWVGQAGSQPQWGEAGGGNQVFLPDGPQGANFGASRSLS